MNRTCGRQPRQRLGLESQDDVGYLTGKHTLEDQEKQIRSPRHKRREDQRKEGRIHRDGTRE